MAGDVDEARRLLAKGLDWVVLRRDEDGHLWAEVRGILAGLLNLEDADLVARAGAGSPSRIVPYHSVQVSWLPPANLRRS